MKTLTAMLLAALAFGVSPAQAQAPIKIGFVAELSGPQGVLGSDQYDAFMLAVEENGGKLGGVPVEIFKEDSKLKPEIGVQAVEKLIGREGVQIITGITFSNMMMAVLKPVTEKEVFLVGSNGGPAPAAGASCSPYLFMTSWQNDMQSEVVGKYATEQGYKKVIALAPNYQAGKDYIEGFKRYFEGDIVDEIYTPLNQPDFSAELTRVAAMQPDAVFVFYPGGLGINFVRQYKQLGLSETIPLLTVATIDGTTLPAMQEAALGAKVGSYWSPDLPVPENAQFIKAFQEKYGRIPSQYAAQSYDAALLIDSAIAQVGGDLSDKQAFMRAMKKADFKSTRGAFRFGNNNFPIQDMHILHVVKEEDGTFALKTLDTPLKDHQDSYHQECPMG